MEILIIGGSRFVGPLLVEKLKKKHQLTLFNRGNIKSSYRDVEFIKGDRDSGFKIRKRFDAVIDMVAYEGKQTEMAIEQLEFDFFIHMGTAAAYEKSEIFPLNEASPLGSWPLWGDYNKGKVECEEVLADSGIKYASIRPTYILGANNYVEREQFIFSKLKEKQRIILPGNGQALVQFAFVQDVAECFATVLEKKARGGFNCAGNEIISLRGLVEEMAKISGTKADVSFNPAHDGDNFIEAEFPFANENLVLSNQKMRDLGVKFTPLLQGMAKDYKEFYSKII